MNASQHDIKNYCLRLLSRREYSQKELFSKSIQKGFAQDAIQSVLDELVTNNWQSDARFAENYAKYRLKKGYGAHFIRYELNQKGIDIASDNLNDVLLTVAEDWQALLIHVYCKKYGEIVPITRYDWSKRSRFLLQRGFSNSQITQFASKLHFIHS